MFFKLLNKFELPNKMKLVSFLVLFVNILYSQETVLDNNTRNKNNRNTYINTTRTSKHSTLSKQTPTLKKMHRRKQPATAHGNETTNSKPTHKTQNNKNNSTTTTNNNNIEQTKKQTRRNATHTITTRLNTRKQRTTHQHTEHEATTQTPNDNTQPD